MSEQLSNDPCGCAHCRMNKLEAMTVDLRAAQAELDKSMAELEAQIAETNESLAVSTESLSAGTITLTQEEAAKMWHGPLAVHPLHSDVVAPLVTVRSIFKEEYDRLRESGNNGVSASLGGILKIVDSLDERISLIEKALSPVVVVSGHDSSPSVGDSTGTPEPTEGGATAGGKGKDGLIPVYFHPHMLRGLRDVLLVAVAAGVPVEDAKPYITEISRFIVENRETCK